MRAITGVTFPATPQNIKISIGGGGTGGGGNGSTNGYASSGTDNLGGGGGGGNNNAGAGSGPGNGGDGVVFLRVATSDYPGAGNVSGKTTITTDGSDTIIKWTTSGGYLA